MKLRLTSSGLVDVDFTGTRLLSNGIVSGSAASTTIAVDDAYSVTTGNLLTVTALLGILANDIYRCTEFTSFDTGFDSSFNGQR